MPAAIRTGSIHRLARQLLQSISIKSVQGLALLQHHHIGDVDHSIDPIDASTFQTLLHPCGRTDRTVEALDQRQAIETPRSIAASLVRRCSATGDPDSA